LALITRNRVCGGIGIRYRGLEEGSIGKVAVEAAFGSASFQSKAMAESPDRMGRFRRMVDAAADDVVDEEEDVAKDRLAETKACYGMSRAVWYQRWYHYGRIRRSL
jgi:hypothetical protein